MANEVRSGMLRGARAETGEGARSGNTNRGSHVGRGTYVDYYKDIGISTTKEGAKQFKDTKAAHDAAVAAAQAEIDAANQQVESQYAAGQSAIKDASGKIPEFNKALQTAWKTSTSDFVKVNVVKQDGKGGYITEGTYSLPKTAAQDLAKKQGVATNWGKDGQFYVDVKTSQGGRYIGEELHTAFSQGEKDIYNKWYVSAAPQIKRGILDNKAEIGKATGMLGESYATNKGMVNASQVQVDSAKEIAGQDWQKMKDDYNKKKATIASIFGNFKVDEAKK